MSVALLSLQFIEDAGLTYVVAPVVSFELQDEAFKPHTPFPEHILNLIVLYCKPLFASEYDLKRYVLNNMKRDGTEIFVLHLRNPNKNLVGCELEATADDITLNQGCSRQLEINY